MYFVVFCRFDPKTFTKCSNRINEREKIVTLFDFDHHDNVYKT